MPSKLQLYMQMRELLIHKANAAYLLGLEERKQHLLLS